MSFGPPLRAAFSEHSSKLPLTQTVLAHARLGLAALLVVGVYLAIDWVNTDQVDSINEKYWRYDTPREQRRMVGWECQDKRRECEHKIQS
jgi:hypothetical protein